METGYFVKIGGTEGQTTGERLRGLEEALMGMGAVRTMVYESIQIVYAAFQGDAYEHEGIISELSGKGCIIEAENLFSTQPAQRDEIPENSYSIQPVGRPVIRQNL